MSLKAILGIVGAVATVVGVVCDLTKGCVQSKQQQLLIDDAVNKKINKIMPQLLLTCKEMKDNK